MIVKIKEFFLDFRREDFGFWMKEMKIIEIVIYFFSLSVSYLLMGFIFEINFYLKKNELYVKLIYIKRKDYVYIFYKLV